VRRSLLAVALPLVLATLLLAAEALSARDVEARRPPPQKPLSPSAIARTAYASARAHGQPIALLTRATALRASPGGPPVAKLRRRTEWRSPRVLPVLGERRGWLRVMAAELANGATGWIPASAAGLTWSPWKVRASLSRREVEVLDRGRVVRRFPVAIGRPTTPTPTGRFAVTDKLYIGGGTGAYGCCAIALTGHQPHLEPGWGGGDRLAIHGTDSPGTIGAAASFGCLRASDADARWLVRRLYLGTIVEIRY
jgi:lipoprotein-anchoring transpeptidase ErfK/SrfK